MTLFLLELAIRAALIALGTAAVLKLLRIQSPAVRHAAWTAVVIAMLVLPVWRAGGVRLSLPVLQPAPAADSVAPQVGTDPIAPVDAADLAQSTEPAPTATGLQAVSRPLGWQVPLIALYVLGVAVLGVRLVLGTVQANRLRRTASVRDGRLTSKTCATPVTVGWFRPSLILPEGWQRWPALQLDAVLTHEREHARRHDPLVQWLALLNRAVFWFHPVAWWLERRLSTLSEEACDSVVLAAGHSPQSYSEYLLEMARSVTREGRRLNVNLVGMAMPGSGLSQRMRQILSGVPLTPVSRARVLGAVAFCGASSVMFAAGTLAERTVSAGVQQAGSAAAHRFDVVSIKPCSGTTPPPTAAPLPSGGRGGVAPWHAQTSPGYVRWDCVTLATLVDQAYADRDHPLLNIAGDSRPPRPDSFKPKRIRGGPPWVETDKFTIEARAPIDVTNAALQGSPSRNLAALSATMSQALRAVLEDRFQLKVRRATEQQDMYALTIAKSGLHRELMKTTTPGDCVGADDYFATDPAARGNLRICGRYAVTRTAWELTGFTLRQLTQELSNVMELFVLDKTGIENRFTFVLDFAAVSGVADDRFVNALERLGLKIERTKGPAEYLQIDSAQRPRPDSSPVSGAGTLEERPEQQAPTVPAPASSGMRIKFDVVSIKPCHDGPQPGGRGSNAIRGRISPGYVYWACETLNDLIDNAWGGFFPHNDLLNTIKVPPNTRLDVPARVRGGPSWVTQDRFRIEITMSGDTTDLTGSARVGVVRDAIRPAMRAMLEDRFQLKLRKATEQRPMYAMTVARDGLKITKTGGDKCWPVSPDTPRGTKPTPPPGFEGLPSCSSNVSMRRRGSNDVLEFTDIKLADFAKYLSEDMDRYVIDKTGVEGRFSFPLEFAPDASTPGSIETSEMFARAGAQLLGRPATQRPKSDGPTIFEALESLGLKLEPTRGPAEYLLIESVQRPRPDRPRP
jgi:uncharacterized protein (TIGR03435 family)